MRSLLPVFILFLGFYSIASARRINLIVKKTNGWHDSATIQSVNYEKLGRKSWDELTEVEKYLLETQHALRGLNSDFVSEHYDYQEGEYDDNEASIDSQENSIEDSDEDDEENSVSDEAFEDEGIDDNNNGKDENNGSSENQWKKEDDESEDSEQDSSEDLDEDRSTETDESLPEEDLSKKLSETSHHYNHRRRIGGRAARVWNTIQYQYYHLSVHYLINVYFKLRRKIDI